MAINTVVMSTDSYTTRRDSPVLLIGILIIGLIAGLAAWIGRRSGSGGQGDDPTRARLASIGARTRIALDQEVYPVMSAPDPGQMQTRWASADATLAGLAAELEQLVPVVGTEAIRPANDLAVSLAALRSALDQGRRTRTENPGDTELIASTDRSIYSARDRAVASLAALEAIGR